MVVLMKWTVAFVMAAIGFQQAYAAEIGESKSSGILSVRSFGAKGDGVTDDTAAIQAAIFASGTAPSSEFWKTRTVYFPVGTYIVSSTLLKRDASGHFDSGLVLVGAEKNQSIIRLRDKSSGFGDRTAPRPVVMTASRLIDGSPTSGGKDWPTRGEGNDAYINVVENLTIDVGAQNPGAIALDYLGNNLGAVRHVRLLAQPGSGAVGLSMIRKWIGPALVSDVDVSGFPVGVDIANSEYGVTMVHVRISGSTVAGLRNFGNLVAVDGLDVTNASGPAIDNGLPGGLIVLAQATLAGVEGSAIRNRGYLNLAHVRASGFTAGISGTPPRADLDGIYSPATRIGEPDWRLAPRDPPAAVADPPDTWCDIRRTGADPTGRADSSQAIRACLESGARTVLIPFGVYGIGETIGVPATVERIVGEFSTLTALDARKPAFTRTAGMLSVATDGPPLTITKLAFDMTDRGAQLAIDHSGARTLVLEDIISAGTHLIRREHGGGPLFVDDACCGPATIAGPAGAWLRQFNSEGNSARLIDRGAPIRVLGLKAEHMVTIVDNAGGGTVEIAGGFVYPVVPGVANTPLVINRAGRVVLSYVEEAFRSDATYQVHLLSNAAARERSVRVEDLFQRNDKGARIVPQLTDGPP